MIHNHQPKMQMTQFSSPFNPMIKIGCGVWGSQVAYNSKGQRSHYKQYETPPHPSPLALLHPPLNGRQGPLCRRRYCRNFVMPIIHEAPLPGGFTFITFVHAARQGQGMQKEEEKKMKKSEQESP